MSLDKESLPEGPLGHPRPGDEVWSGALPVIVYINRIQETASLGFTMANGASLSVTIRLATAEGLIKDLELKEVGL